MNRHELWLDFLAVASERTSSWHVWKNADRALRGRGDVDAFCDPRELPIVEEVFAGWAVRWGLGPAFVCGHIPGGSNLVALAHDRRSLLEVGTKQWKTFRGSVLVNHQDLSRSIEWDARGFRRTTAASETALKLVLNGVAPVGKPNWPALRALGILEGIRDDPQGLRDFVSSLPSLPTTATLSLARAAIDGRWDRPAALRVEANALLRTVRRPDLATNRAVFKLSRSVCPIVLSLQNGRSVGVDAESWVRLAASTHRRLA